MPEVITLDGIKPDPWTLVEAPAEGEALELPEGPAIVPLSWWLENRDAVAGRRDIGVWFESDDEPERLGEECVSLPLIAVNFPKFTDGRGYSIARLLRERYGYPNELRAIGDVLLDQLFYMKRCGFDSFKLRADKDINKAEACLNVFRDAHQAAVDEPSPLFRRRSK
ncbi:DUF934 domain-containing protein [Marinobacteraceae bacterium S3BR75-40.1]